MPTNYVLIDFENVQVKSLALLQGEHFRVKVFLGPKNNKLPVELVLAMQQLGDRADYIVLEVSSANALDFHITYYLGKLVAVDPTGVFHIISKDKGFDLLIKHLNTRNISCTRSASIEQMVGMVTAPVANYADSLAATHKARAKPAPKPKAPSKALSDPHPKAAAQSKASPKSNSKTPPKVDLKESSAKSFLAPTVDETLFTLAFNDLVKRTRPGTTIKLMNTIHAKCGKEKPVAEIQKVYDALVSRGYVKVSGTKVAYVLPLQDQLAS